MKGASSSLSAWVEKGATLHAASPATSGKGAGAGNQPSARQRHPGPQVHGQVSWL